MDEQYGYTNFRGYQVPIIEPLKHDFGYLDNILQHRSERSDKALAARAQLQQTLASMDLNEAEDNWKQVYLQGFLDKIDDAAMFGDYAGAFDTAIKASGDAVSDPRLLGRQRYQKKFEEARATILKLRDSGEIDDRHYDYWKEQNEYNYNDIYDSNNNWIGGTTFSSTEPPLPPDYISVLNTLNSLVQAQSSSNETAQESVAGGHSSGESFVSGAEVQGARDAGRATDYFTQSKRSDWSSRNRTTSRSSVVSRIITKDAAHAIMKAQKGFLSAIQREIAIDLKEAKELEGISNRTTAQEERLKELRKRLSYNNDSQAYPSFVSEKSWLEYADGILENMYGFKGLSFKRTERASSSYSERQSGSDMSIGDLGSRQGNEPGSEQGESNGSGDTRQIAGARRTGSSSIQQPFAGSWW